MPQETPGDVRQAELSRDRLNTTAEDRLVPDWTGLHGFSLLDAVRKYPVVIPR
jgi:hypothetical protein